MIDPYFWYDPFGSAPRTSTVTGSTETGIVHWSWGGDISQGWERPRLMAITNREKTERLLAMMMETPLLKHLYG
jgi:hypothetical protein